MMEPRLLSASLGDHIEAKYHRRETGGHLYEHNPQPVQWIPHLSAFHPLLHAA